MGWSTHHPTGLIYHAPQHSYRGYTLVTTLRGQYANLIDMEGRICHRWYSEEGIGYGYLLPNGHLLFRVNPDAEEVSFATRPGGVPVRGGAAGGPNGAIIEVDWDGHPVWEHRQPLLHHDFERLPNGTRTVTAEQYRDEIAATQKRIPDIHFKIEDEAITDNTWWVRWTRTGTNTETG